MFHYVYEITNNINGRKYIGKHSTNNLNDNYMGSGKALLKAINKYGIENFSKNILIICESEKEAYSTFNMGVGFCVVCSPCDLDEVIKICTDYNPFILGEVV